MSNDYQYLLSKAKKYCTYQERCLHEIKTKLQEWETQPKVAEKIIVQLIHGDYLNEERFAKIFTLGKFRQKKWGENKIIRALKQKGIPDLIIQIGLTEIKHEEYTLTLISLLKRKSKEIKEKNIKIKNYKLAAYAIRKGFRSESVWQTIDHLNNN